MNKLDKFILKFGLWFGRLIIILLEIIFPSFKNKRENLHKINDSYLEHLNLSNKERFKRYIKVAIEITFGILFWVYFIIFGALLLNLGTTTIYFLLSPLSMFALLFILLVLFAYYFAYKQ